MRRPTPVAYRHNRIHLLRAPTPNPYPYPNPYPTPNPNRTPLHKALYLGHLSIAAELLRNGASLEISDHKGRLPADLISSELRRRLGPWAGELLHSGRRSRAAGVAVVAPSASAAATGAAGGSAASLAAGGGAASAAPAPTFERSLLYAWGSGANWQLGVGSQEVNLAPIRVDHGLSGALITAVAASKFHSAAVTGDGRAWAWGWARGGRLGIDDALLSRQGGRGAAQIVPRSLEGLGRRQVVAIAAAKHHTLAATAAGELWSWGSNRWGALGHTGVDTQPTPRRCVVRMVVRMVGGGGGRVDGWVGGLGSWLYTAAINGAAVEREASASHIDARAALFVRSLINSHHHPISSSPINNCSVSLMKQRVVSVAAANKHSAAITSAGEVFTWGGNR